MAIWGPGADEVGAGRHPSGSLLADPLQAWCDPNENTNLAKGWTSHEALDRVSDLAKLRVEAPPNSIRDPSFDDSQRAGIAAQNN